VVERLTATRKNRATGTAARSGAGSEGMKFRKMSQAMNPDIIDDRAPNRFAFGHQMPAVNGTKSVASRMDHEFTISE